MTRENDLLDALSFINYKGDFNNYLIEFQEYFNILGIKENYSYSDILKVNCLYCTKNSLYVQERNIVDLKRPIGINLFKKNIKNFLSSINQKNNQKREYVAHKIEKFGNALYACITIKTQSNIQQRTKSKKNENNIQSHFYIMLSNTEKKLYYHRAPSWIISYFDWWLKSKLNIKYEEYNLQKFSKNDLIEFINNSDLKIQEIAFRRTKISISDEIIIKSVKGEGKKYFEKFADARIIDTPSIYDLKHIKFLYKDQSKDNITFNRKKGFNIELISTSKIPKELPLSIKKYVNNNYLLMDEVDTTELLQYVIQQQKVDKYDYDVKNIYVRKYLELLKGNKLIKIKPVYQYWCENPNCQSTFEKKSPIPTKECPYCKKTSRNKFIAYYHVEIDYSRIRVLLGNGIKQFGYKSYKTMPNNYFGFTNARILRLSNKEDNQYSYILLNKKGLSKEEIELLKKRGIPMLVINLKGEVSSTLEGFEPINAGELLNSLLKKDFKLISQCLEFTKKESIELKTKAFKYALESLKSNNIESPEMFEVYVFAIFNLIFQECQKWGGPNVADGALTFKHNFKNNYLLWDAKKYDKSSLLTYVEEKSIKKDIGYMIKFSKNAIIKELGSLKYYMFVTSETGKEEFDKIKVSLEEKMINKNKNLDKIKVLCINKDQLIILSEYFINNYSNLMKSYAEFIKIIESNLLKNGGYFEFQTVKTELDKLTNLSSSLPDVSSLR